MPKNPPKINEKQPPTVVVAAWQDNKQWIEAYLDEGASPDAVDNNGLTLLAKASARDQQAMAQLLLKRGASIELECGQKTPLMWAAYQGHVLMIKLLLAQKAKINARNAQGETALMCATEQGESGAVEELLEAGANLFVGNKEGTNALQLAQKLHNKEIEEILQKHKTIYLREKKKKKAAAKKGYELVTRAGLPLLDAIENQNAPAIWDWCAIQ